MAGVTIIKRSTAITLILLGTGAAAYVATTQSRVCHDDQGQEVPCRSSRSGGHGGGFWGYSSVSSSSSGASSSSRNSAATATAARGGFGSTGGSWFSGS